MIIFPQLFDIGSRSKDFYRKSHSENTPSGKTFSEFRRVLQRQQNDSIAGVPVTFITFFRTYFL